MSRAVSLSVSEPLSMASDRKNLTSGFLDHQRATLPYSADIRDVPTTEFLGARFWSDDTISLLNPEDRNSRAQRLAGAGSRGWIFYRLPSTPPSDPPLVLGPSSSGPLPPDATIVGTHYIAAEGVLVKRIDADSPSGFSYVLSLRPGSQFAFPSYLIRTGSVHIDGDTAWVHEDVLLSLTTDDLNAGVAPQISFRAGFDFMKIRGYAVYSLPAQEVIDPSNLFLESSGDAAPLPIPRPRNPIIYAVTKASGAYRYASNLVLSYDPVTTERELAIVRGVV